MTNEQMKPGRFLKLHEARKMYRSIVACFQSGYRVQICTHLRATVYPSVDWFKISGSSVYVRRGKNWDCINFSRIRFVA